MWQELERVKRENETLLMQIESIEKDKKTSESEKGNNDEKFLNFIRELNSFKGRIRDS